ncbi:MAG: hydroxymethylbilane synthase [Myxococcota bacterium]
MIRIGSRGSDLALWQARYVRTHLDGESEIIVIKTKGDQIQHLTLDKVEGKGFFTKEIESALLGKDVDLAIHSYKDLPTEPVPGLAITSVPVRAPVRDALVVRADRTDAERPLGIREGATVGTSSLRRKAAIKSLRPDLQLVDIRGNVPTRMGKAQSGELDAVVLAEAGLRRLELYESDDTLRFLPIDVKHVCPAPAQGALAVQIREGDERVADAARAMHHDHTAQSVDLERDLLARFGGGCHLPLGAFATLEANAFELIALVAAPDGSERLSAEAKGTDRSEVLETVYDSLMSQGAERYL